MAESGTDVLFETLYHDIMNEKNSIKKYHFR